MDISSRILPRIPFLGIPSRITLRILPRILRGILSRIALKLQSGISSEVSAGIILREIPEPLSFPAEVSSGFCEAVPAKITLGVAAGISPD